MATHNNAFMESLKCAGSDSFEFPVLLANHAPMAMIAMDQLGASPSRINEWYETYKNAHGLLPPAPPLKPFSQANWTDGLGDRARERDYQAFFLSEVERLGRSAAINLYIPQLIRGVGGSALHPLMRLAYATILEDQKETAFALAYWASCYLPLPLDESAQKDIRDPGVILSKMKEVGGIHTFEPESDLLWHTIRAVGELDDFTQLTSRLAFHDTTKEQMAALAIRLFAATLDFSALHAVTGLHWIRIVEPHLDDPAPLYCAVWQVIAALMPKIGFPTLPDEVEFEAMRELKLPDWDEIKKKAIASDDEHDISLTFSALQENAIWPDKLYQVAAAKRVGLL